MPRRQVNPSDFNDLGRRWWDAMKDWIRRHPDARDAKGRPFVEGDQPSLNKFNDHLGLATGTLSRYMRGERGEQVTPRFIFDIADLLELEARYLWLGIKPERRRTCFDEAAETFLGTKTITPEVIAEAKKDPNVFGLTIEESYARLKRVKSEILARQAQEARERELREEATDEAARTLRRKEKERARESKETPSEKKPDAAPASTRSKHKRASNA